MQGKHSLPCAQLCKGQCRSATPSPCTRRNRPANRYSMQLLYTRSRSAQHKGKMKLLKIDGTSVAQGWSISKLTKSSQLQVCKTAPPHLATAKLRPSEAFLAQKLKKRDFRLNITDNCLDAIQEKQKAGISHVGCAPVYTVVHGRPKT